jgi:hypothetical protein
VRAACPAKALVFGDLNDPESEVSRLAGSSRGTKLLEDLGTLPKVTYLLRPSDASDPVARASTINEDLLRPLLETSWRFWPLVAVLAASSPPAR